MTRKRSIEPTEAEMRLLRVFWQRGAPTLRFTEIAESIELARTTVATTLKVMAEKRFVKRVEEDGKVAWRCMVTRESTSRKSIQNLIQRLFDGSAKSLVAHLIEDGRLTSAERAEIAKLIEEAEDR